MTRYRVVRDSYAGFEAQVWRWWFPFWVQLGGCNTHVSLERAKGYIERRRNPVVAYVE